MAANHSVWDLEPEYLSAEALLLIYADFRVKQTHDPEGHEITHISSLAEAFDVILNKLDDVDGEKRRRYTRVYARLQGLRGVYDPPGSGRDHAGGGHAAAGGAGGGPDGGCGGAGVPDHAVCGPQHGADGPAYRAAELCLPAGAGSW
ncbi:MAG: hypothetical protein ACLR01_04625 [Vescimonas sp.]